MYSDELICIPHPKPLRDRSFNDYLVPVNGVSLLLSTDGKGSLSRRDRFISVDKEEVYVGEYEGEAVYAFRVEDDFVPPENHLWHTFRELLPVVSSHHLDLCCRILQLLDWREQHAFCGRCGTPTEAVDHEHARRCPSCGLMLYPRVAPVVVCAVIRDQKILLAHNANFPVERYSVISGFCEAGESLEQSAAREVFEETGIRIKNIRYIASRPWPFPSNIMAAFVADWAGGDIVVDGCEIDAADWFEIDALPDMPWVGTISRLCIDYACGVIAGKI